VTGLQPWAVELATRKGHDKTTIAVANKLARIVWAVWARDVSFEARAGRRVTSFSSVTKELLSDARRHQRTSEHGRHHQCPAEVTSQ
jgi:hypothetical protein